jgi:hypothetical protein
MAVLIDESEDKIRYYRDIELFNKTSYFGKNKSISLYYDRNM